MQYEILVPRDQERDALAAAGLIQDLCDLFVPELGGVQFHVDNLNGKARYSVILPLRQMKRDDPNSFDAVPLEEVAVVVRRFYPRALVVPTWWKEITRPVHQRLMRFVRSKSPVGDFQPYLTFDRVRGNDPLSGLARLLAKTPETDTASYGVMVLSARITEFQLNKTMLWVGRLFNVAVNQKDPWAMHDNMRREQTTMEARAYKAAEGSLAVIPYVGYLAADKNRLQSADALAQVMMQFPQDVPFARDYIRVDKPIKSEDDDRYLADTYFMVNDLSQRNQGTRYSAEDDMYLMTPRELATLWHLPDNTYPDEYINWLEETTCRELPEQLQGLSEGVLIGVNEGCGRPPVTREVRLPRHNTVFHNFVVGRVGTGKSRLIFRHVLSQIRAGRGVCVIDPHGSHEEGLVSWLLNEGIPASRIDDVVWIDFANITTNPPAINPLLSAGSPHLVAGDFVATLARVFEDEDLLNTRMGDWLKLALRTIAVQSDATLSDVRKVLRDKDYRRGLLSQSSEVSLLEDWEDFDKADRQENSISGILTRVRRLMERNETIAMVCHPQPVHYGKLLSEGKIVLVAAGGASSPLSYQERMAFSSIIVTQIMDAAFAGMYEQPVTMYIDETRNFVNAPIDYMLRETRKFKLGLFLTSQGMAALSPKMQEAIEETVGTLIGFEMSEADAKMFKPYVSDVYTTDELQTLGRFSAAVSTRYNGERLRAFEVNTLPPEPPAPDVAKGAEVRRRSIENYAPMRYGEVLDHYKKRHTAVHELADELVPDEHIKRG